MKKDKIYNSSNFADFHLHSNSSIDGTKTIPELFEKAQKENTALFSVTDHNTFIGVNSFLDKQNIDRYAVLPSFNNIHLLTGVEITAKIKEIPNVKNNPSKIHLVAYGIDRNDDSPIAQILKMKRKNDENVDFGFLYQINKQLNLQFSEKDILKFYRQKKIQNPKLDCINKQDTIEFLQSHNMFINENPEDLYNIFNKIHLTSRLTLEAKDVINLVHASGGIVLMAHPYSNLKRTRKPKDLIEYLINNDIDGFEMYYPFNNYHSDILLRKICKDYDVTLFSGGSDYHDDNQVYNDDLHIKYEPITEDKTKAFIEYMSDVDYARKKGTLITKNYKHLKDFKINNTIEKYKKQFCKIENLEYNSFDVLELE